MGLFMRACSHPVLCFYALLSRQLELHKEVGKEDTEKRPPLQPPCMPRFQSRVTVTRELDYNVDWLRYSFKTLLIVAVTVIHTSCEINIKLEQKQFRLETGFEPMTSAIPVQRSTSWAIKPRGEGGEGGMGEGGERKGRERNIISSLHYPVT